MLWYLGENICSDGSNDNDVERRILDGTRAAGELKMFLKAKEVSIAMKIKLYRTVVEPVVLFGSET